MTERARNKINLGWHEVLRNTHSMMAKIFYDFLLTKKKHIWESVLNFLIFETFRGSRSCEWVERVTCAREMLSSNTSATFPLICLDRVSTKIRFTGLDLIPVDWRESIWHEGLWIWRLYGFSGWVSLSRWELKNKDNYFHFSVFHLLVFANYYLCWVENKFANEVNEFIA